MICILGDESLAGTRWVTLRERRFLDLQGREKTWAYLERNGNREAAVVVARSERSDSLLLIRQFRIPLGCWVLEFPAGLVDDGEAPAAAAARELYEETGYRGTLLGENGPVPTSPGLASELVRFFYMRIPEEPDGPPACETAEQIEVLLLPPDRLAAIIAAPPPDTLLDAKVLAYLAGRGFTPA